MKKILLAAGFLAIASINAFGASCGSFLLSAAPTACDVSGAGGTWTLTNWYFEANGNQFAGFSQQIASNNVSVNVTATSTGFDVTYSGVATNNNNFFAPSGSNQQTNFMTAFWVQPVGSQNSVTGINDIALRLDDPTGTNSYSVTKKFQGLQAQGNLSSPSQVLYQGTTAGCTTGAEAACFVNGTTNPASAVNFGNRQNGISIVDLVAFNSGNGGSGNLGGYTNSFSTADQNGVPEPMTFVLMGAGLVGIAALRRRSS